MSQHSASHSTSLPLTAHALPPAVPLPLTPLIGRRRERTTIAHLLGTTRLLTLTGAGGCGKTRLALAVAEAVTGEYADGVAVVELAPLADPTRVSGAVAAMLDVREQPGVPLPVTLIAALRPRAMLLVLDNCEHVLEAAALFAAQLLAACPHLTILATSREALGVAGEVTYRVPPLSLPNDTGDVTPAHLRASEAAQLFVDRAGARQPGFTVTQENAPAIATICRRLDGIPLALELAAARIGTMPLDAIAARLDDALDLLTTGNRAALPRQRTLRATLAWSDALLDAPERTILRRLSACVGGCTLPVATAVCAEGIVPVAAVPELLARLVEKSLLVLEGEGDAARYRLLETVRQYAAERLDAAGETAAVRERHAAYILTVAEGAKDALGGPEQGAWFARLDADLGNIRAALAWSHAVGESERGLQISANLYRFWLNRGYLTEAAEWLDAFLAADGGKVRTEVRLHALFIAGRLAIFRGDHDTARRRGRVMLAEARAQENGFAIATALTMLGTDALEQQAYAEANALLIEGLGYARATEDGYQIALATGLIGLLATMRGDLPLARRMIEESWELYGVLGDVAELARLCRWRGIVAIEERDFARARALFTEGLDRHRALQSRTGIAEGLEGFAALAAAEGDPARALTFAGAADAIRTAIGAPLPPHLGQWFARRFDAARQRLGTIGSDAAWLTGRAMPAEDAVALATAASLPPHTKSISHLPASADRRAAKQWYGGLTAREREIAALIVGDRSNREIANTLFIAEKTVETHIGNALRKLGFAARAQLADWAVAVGLTIIPDAAPPPAAPQGSRRHVGAA